MVPGVFAFSGFAFTMSEAKKTLRPFEYVTGGNSPKLLKNELTTPEELQNFVGSPLFPGPNICKMLCPKYCRGTEAEIGLGAAGLSPPGASRSGLVGSLPWKMSYGR